MAKACGVGRRTIFRDLETLREAGVPLEFDAAAQRYSIACGFFVPTADLTAEETLSIMTLADAYAQQRRNLPFYLSVQSAAAKLERNLPPPVRQKLRKTTRAVRIRPNRVVALTDKTTVYERFVEAIEKRQVAQVEYESLTEWERISTKLRPYQLLFSQHSWYVIGHSSLHRDVRTFNLAQTSSVTLLSQRFTLPRGFDLERHLGNAWHLISDAGSDSRVVLRFSSLVARNVAEVTWHKTQRTKSLADGSLEFHATVSGLNEIAWWILGYGDQVEVLQPVKLRRLVGQRARNMAAMYKE